MPVFAYKAYDADARDVTGSLTADTAAAGRQILRQQGLHPLEFRPAEFSSWRLPRLFAGKGRRQDQTAEFARQLSMLLSTGIPLAEALDVLICQQTGKLVPVLRDIRDKVAAGTSFADALQPHPEWFDAIFCSAVNVGQLSGHMDSSLKELAAYVRERQTIKSQLFTALTYPMILSVLGVGVVIFLMSYVVPQLLAVLETSDRSLPAATVVLKAISDFLVGYWPAILGGLFVMVVGGTAFLRWRPGRYWCHKLEVQLPLVGVLRRKSIIAQFAQAMSLLLHSGVPFIDALRLVRSGSSHLVLESELEQMESAIKRGSDLAPTLKHSRIFPPLVVHIFNVGQATGELTEMLQQLKEAYETEVRLAIAKFTATLEPLLIVIMSAIVGFVVFATLMPILEVTRAIQ